MMTLGLPLLMVIVGAASFFVQTRADTTTRLALVDERAELDGSAASLPESNDLALSVSPSRAAAEAALQRGEVDGYLVIPAGFAQGATPHLYLGEEPSGSLRPALASFLRRAAAPDAPEWVLDRLDDPAVFTYQDARGQNVLSGGVSLALRVVTPVALALAFALMVFTGISQMGPAMAREKDQRVMEMVITSLSPRDLVAGKVLGTTMLSLTQFAVWGLGILLAAVLALTGRVEWATLSIPWRAVAWAALLGIPAYFLFALLAAGLGIIAGDSQQARQLAGMLGFFGLVPLWFAGAIVNAPDSPAAVALTIFPLTSPTIGLLRMALTEVPLWQLGLALALILVSMVAALWFVARIFHAAMLLYGQALRPRAIWRALAGAG